MAIYGDQQQQGIGEQLVDKTGAMFGGLFHLPSNIAPFVQLGLDFFTPDITGKVDEVLKKQLPQLLDSKVGGAKAKLYTKIAANTINYAVVFNGEAIGLYKTTAAYAASMRELSHALAPVAKASQGSILGITSGELGSNEVVKVAKSKIRSAWSKSLSHDVSRLATSLPQAWVMHVRGQAGKHEAHFASLSDAQMKVDPTFIKVDGQQKFADRVARFSALAPQALNLASSSDQGTRREDIALDLIRHLAKEIAEEPGARTIDSPSGRGQYKVEQFVAEIFNTHQKNMKQPEIGPRQREAFDYATSRIAEEISEGRLDPMSLVTLIGGRKIVTHEGKKIGNRAEVDRAIAECEKKMPAHAPIDADAYMKDAALSADDIKGLLHGLKGSERDYFISLFPDEVMQRAGLKHDEIIQSHQKSAEHFLERSKEAINAITERDPAELKEGGLTDEDISALEELKYSLKRKGNRAIKDAISRPGSYNGIETTIANYRPYWESIVKDPNAAKAHAKAKPERRPAHDDLDHHDRDDEHPARSARRERRPANDDFGYPDNDDDRQARPGRRVSEREYHGSEELDAGRGR